MEKLAFRMRLKSGTAVEYRSRHDALWPELAGILRETGISDYSIFLDADGVTLFAVLWCSNLQAMSALPDHPLMQRWWTYMADLMDTEPDGRPVTWPLDEVFRLP